MITILFKAVTNHSFFTEFIWYQMHVCSLLFLLLSHRSFFPYRSYLDILKVAVFRYLFWFVLCVIFITGTARVNIFCVGYLLAFFYFMFFGKSLQLKPAKDILRLWDYLIAYTAFVIVMKNFFAVGIGSSFSQARCWNDVMHATGWAADAWELQKWLCKLWVHLGVCCMECFFR